MCNSVLHANKNGIIVKHCSPFEGFYNLNEHGLISILRKIIFVRIPVFMFKVDVVNGICLVTPSIRDELKYSWHSERNISEH